jgi:hypothetical protein
MAFPAISRKNIKLMSLLQKYLFVVRQAHHERQKVNDFNNRAINPELVKGCFGDFCKSLLYEKPFFYAVKSAIVSAHRRSRWLA